MLDELCNALRINQKVQITVWDPQDNAIEHQFPSYIMDVETRRFLIAPPARDTEGILSLMQPGYLAGVVLELPNNPYILYPSVYRHQIRPEGIWFQLSSDTVIETVYRRRHVRIPMRLPLRIQHLDDSSTAITEDISGGGIRFSTDKAYPLGVTLSLQLRFSPQGPLLELEARVLQVERSTKLAPDELYSVACEFHNLSNAHESIIMRECFRKELS